METPRKDPILPDCDVSSPQAHDWGHLYHESATWRVPILVLSYLLAVALPVTGWVASAYHFSLGRPVHGWVLAVLGIVVTCWWAAT